MGLTRFDGRVCALRSSGGDSALSMLVRHATQ